jgi:hypothetical protein
MRKYKYDKEIVEKLVQQYNPFGLRGPANEPMVFGKASEAYLYVMTKIYTECPRGYVETPYILSLLYAKLSFHECKVLADDLADFGVREINFTSLDKKHGKQFLEMFCRALNTMSESRFDSGAFQEAYQLLVCRMELEKTMKEK